MLKSFGIAVVACLALAATAQAQTASGWMKWMGVNGAWGSYNNTGTGGAQWNVYTSPYLASFKIPSDVPHDWHLPVNGGSAFGPTDDIYCVDFNHYANTGTSQVFFTNLGTGSGFLGTYTRSNSLQNYLAAAYLASQVQLHPTQAGILNGAIWQIMSGQPNYWWDGHQWVSVASTASYALTTGWQSVQAKEWVVVTNGYTSTTGVHLLGGQEYITHVTPEPATLLLLGTGLVLVLMTAGVFRRRVA